MVAHATAPLTVLVVDDIEDSRRVLKRMLELMGCGVLEAASGQEAVVMARQMCPDLILMDLNLPTLDGLMATQQIRVGYGLAGYSDQQMAPLFAGVSKNCQLPEEWKPYLQTEQERKKGGQK